MNRHILRTATFLTMTVLFFLNASGGSAQTDPLAVKRENPVFREALTARKLDRHVSSWYHGLYLNHMPPKVKALYTEKRWAGEQENYFRESAEAGMDGPFGPWSINNFGIELLERFHRDYGMVFPGMMHTSVHAATAKKKGAVFTCDVMVACWDPAYRAAADEFIENWLTYYGAAQWHGEIMGRDEPLNYAATIRNPRAVGIVNADIRRDYGLKLAIPPADTTVVWSDWPTDPMLAKSPHDAALLRIAMWRWLNGRLHDAAAHEHGIVRRLAPGKPHYAYNRNAINIRDVLVKEVSHSIDFLDQARMYDVTDGFAADPYPTAPLARDGRERALYHTGFTAKLVTDLAAGKPTKMILQAFTYGGHTPTPDNLREWASQAAKGGATHIEWYEAGNTRFSQPALYSELLRISRLWKDLPALDIPGAADVAVVFSDDSRAAANDSRLDGHYSLHVMLGERLGAWYTFIGENHVRRGLQSLDRAGLILAPRLSHVSREFAEKLAARVEGGATLVLLDPEALTWDIETGSLDLMRMRIAGSAPGKPRAADFLIPTKEARTRFGGIGRLPVAPGGTVLSARIPKGAVVLFTYPDGSPAAWSRPMGKGEVIAFAAYPFGTCAPAFSDGWTAFFSALLDRAGVRRNLPVWRFELPKTGGEVRTFRPLVDMDYTLLSGKTE